jgi:predicted unusual protein kinase regulating ubiquinone biosynthesis (AarF/ABC1/UbiB family)
MIRARYRRIILFFARILVSVVFWDLFLPRIGFAKWSNNTRSERYRKIAVRFRSLAIQMGGVMIKVGQFLSARVDVLPEVVTTELAGLQDEVPSESFEDIRVVIETEFGIPLAEKFFEFEPIPLAAASLGQAHLAKIILNNEQAEKLAINLSDSDKNHPIEYPVVVKVQRPGIEKIIATDLTAIRTVGGWIKRYPPIQKRVNVPGLIAEFSRVLYEEIDYLAEGRNAETFAFNFSNHPEILVPKVVWSHTTKRVLSLQDVRGIKITDYDEISNARIDKAEVAARLLDTYLKQIFEDGFFHADPHPGNLFVMPITDSLGDPSSFGNWKLTFIDFGMVGRMRTEIREGLRELLIGIGLQDATRVVESYQILGILLPGADIALLEKADAEMFKRFWGKGMDEISQISMEEIHAFTYEFREILYEMPFQLPQDLIFLGRAVGILSGMCMGLDPQINIFKHLGPFTQKIIAEEAKHDWSYWVQEAGDIARKLISLPIRADSVLTKLEKGKIIIQDPQLSENIRKLERTVSKAIGGIIFATFLMASVQLSIADQEPTSWVFRIASLFALLWIILKR